MTFSLRSGRRIATLYGYPGVSAVRVNGRQLGRPATHSGRRRVVTLRPGGTAHAVLGVVEAGNVCRHPVNGAQLRVYPPGQKGAQYVPLSVQVGRRQSTMHVLPVRRATGVPNYATS
ncbi:MAG: DUF4232 domain-containing protein [Streptosporangiaceae bacterium]|jgi:hypothetical protein